MYYNIDESVARRANDLNSFSEYEEGSATRSYRKQVDQAAELAARCKKGRDADAQAKIDQLLDAYARRLADHINARNRNSASCPSVLIAGPARFPVKKKQRQNAREDRLMVEYQEIQALLDKIRTVGTGGVQSDDPDALEKLAVKLQKRKDLQQQMKDVNAYYRKHKTLDGCPHLTEEQIRRLNAAMINVWRTSPRPFEAYQLSNNNAEIRRLEQRIAELQAAKAAPAVEEERDGYTYRENTEAMRVQFIFDGTPDDAIRAILKAEGFRWAPSQGAWQRQLTRAGISAARRVQEQLKAQ